jgi:hypothetical protein
MSIGEIQQCIDRDHVYINMSALQGVIRALLALVAAVILVSLDPVHAAAFAILVVTIGMRPAGAASGGAQILRRIEPGPRVRSGRFSMGAAGFEPEADGPGCSLRCASGLRLPGFKSFAVHSSLLTDVRRTSGRCRI